MNTNAKHTPRTPGTWQVGPTMEVQGQPLPTVQNRCGLGVAYCMPGDEHLIAAAPALLQELKNTVAAIEKWGKEHPESGGWIGVIHGALKAIAQAEGGAQ